jgi:hypothetical protein
MSPGMSPGKSKNVPGNDIHSGLLKTFFCISRSSFLNLRSNTKINTMEQMLTDARLLPGRWYHIVYYLKKGLQPVLTGENLQAENIVKALELFQEKYPERVDDVLYIVEQINQAKNEERQSM